MTPEKRVVGIYECFPAVSQLFPAPHEVRCLPGHKGYLHCSGLSFGMGDPDFVYLPRDSPHTALAKKV